MANRKKQGPVITYELLADLTGLSLNAVQQCGAPHPAKRRHNLDITSLESVCLWLAAHGNDEFRTQLCGLAAQVLVKDATIRGGVRHRRRGQS